MDDGSDDLSSSTKAILTVVITVLIIGVIVNIYILLLLFWDVVFPKFPNSTFYHYLRLAIIMAIAASVWENLKRKGILFNFLFNIILLVVNSYAIWKNWFAH